ncbi:hypothetical protein HJFPF1_05028 [Paramyrothecium foliicola]|nr:hypothetical protein HJFPF1_05028 [Paramyrothecium foliicola]
MEHVNRFARSGACDDEGMHTTFDKEALVFAQWTSYGRYFSVSWDFGAASSRDQEWKRTNQLQRDEDEAVSFAESLFSVR